MTFANAVGRIPCRTHRVAAPTQAILRAQFPQRVRHATRATVSPNASLAKRRIRPGAKWKKVPSRESRIRRQAPDQTRGNRGAAEISPDGVLPAYCQMWSWPQGIHRHKPAPHGSCCAGKACALHTPRTFRRRRDPAVRAPERGARPSRSAVLWATLATIKSGFSARSASVGAGDHASDDRFDQPHLIPKARARRISEMGKQQVAHKSRRVPLVLA